MFTSMAVITPQLLCAVLSSSLLTAFSVKIPYFVTFVPTCIIGDKLKGQSG